MRIDEEKAAVEAKFEAGKYPKEKQNTFKTFQRCLQSPRVKSLMKNVIKLEQIFRRDNQPSKDSNFSGSQKYNDWQVCSILWILNLERKK